MSGAPERRAELESLFRAALQAVDARACVARAVTAGAGGLCIAGRALPPGVRLRLLAVGKAAAPMARAFEEAAGERLSAGLVVTADGHGEPSLRSALRFAAHPVPDARSEAAADAALALVEGAAADEVLVVLLSGGASSLLAAPVPGVDPQDLAAVTSRLLAAGADIAELNSVRKHLSRVAGGRLAERARAGRVEVLAVSDVPGDRLDVIGSGPFAADPTRYADALRVLDERAPDGIPASVREHLEAGARGERPETPKPGDPGLAAVTTTLLATNRDAVAAAAEAARTRGLRVRVVSEPLTGEAREQGRRLAALAAALRPDAPTCLVAGGETTVTVRGTGRGGRSQELALAAALELDGGPPVALLAAGTDGRDGPTPAAGAHADEGTVRRGARAGADAARALANNDAHGFFAAEGGLLVTGPTGTNVMDLALVRVEPARPA